LFAGQSEPGREGGIGFVFGFVDDFNHRATDAIAWQDLRIFERRSGGWLEKGKFRRRIRGSSSGGTGVRIKLSWRERRCVAADLGYYYSGHNDLGTGLAFGVSLTNLGGKISYTDNADQKDYLPANLGFGTIYSKAFDAQNKISFGLDVNKLLVPTPPADPATPQQMEEYRSKSVVSSWFTSFSDAPGGMSEELKEFYFSVGGEYWYNNQFALRTGYFYENKTKGNRQYFTMGVGIKYQSFGLDFSYLIPSGSGVDRNPLSNTLRFSLHFSFDGSGAATTTN